MALTWRPFRVLLASVSRSLGLYTAGPLTVAAFFKNLFQTLRLVSKDSASYLKAMVILLWIASSISLTRFVVKASMPHCVSFSRSRVTVGRFIRSQTEGRVHRPDMVAGL